MKIWKNTKNSCGNYNTKFGWSFLKFLSGSVIVNKLIETETANKILDKLQDFGADQWIENVVKPTCAVCLEKMEFDDVTDNVDGSLDKAIYNCPKDKLKYVLEGYFKFYYLVEDVKYSEEEIKRVFKLKAFW